MKEIRHLKTIKNKEIWTQNGFSCKTIKMQIRLCCIHMTKYIYFPIFWTLLPQLWSEHLGVLFHWKEVFPKNYAVLPKMPIVLRPYRPKLKSYIYTFQIEIFSRPYFTNLMTGIFHFLMFWTFSSSSMIKTPWSIVSVNGGVARKSLSVYIKC